MTVRAKRGSRSTSVATSRRPASDRRVGVSSPSAAVPRTRITATRSAATAQLLLEQVVETPADVAGARRVGRGITLDGHPERERGTVVATVLVRHPLGDGLFALEAPARVEVGALAAGADGGAAVRTLLERSGRDRQHRAACPASGDRALGEHAAASRRIGRRRLWPALPGGLGAIALLAILAVAVGHGLS